MNRLLLLTICIVFSICTNSFSQNEWLHKGNSQFEMMEYESAIASYTEHLKLNPSDKNALLKLAAACEYINDLDNAARWYYEALGHSVSTEYLLTHGKIQMRLGRYEAAKEQFMIYSSIDKTVGDNYAKMCDYAFGKKNIPSLFQVEKLAINTDHDEYSPSYFGNDLVFASGRKDILRTDATTGVAQGNPKEYNYLFKSKDGTGNPDYLRTWFHDNNLINEGPISYSADGKWVAYVENNYVDGISQMAHDLFKGAIFIAKVNENGDWEQATAFPYNGDYSNNFPHLSTDGNILYFSSNKTGGEGGYDIYMSEKQNGVWTNPRTLGPTINKPGDEISPYMDGKDFYFSSDYLIGFGGQDVFKGNYNNEMWTVSNLGTGINTPGNDYGFIFKKESNSGYLVSDRDGGADIFKVSKTSDDINILVLDAVTKMPIEKAVLDFSNCGKNVFYTNAEGRFSFKASDDLDCWIKINKWKYEEVKLDLDKDSKSKGMIEALLYRKGEQYEGKVTDGINDGNLNEVRIRVLNQKTGVKYEVYSDSDGEYTLALEPRATYMIQYSKLGYVGVGSKVETGDGSDKGILGSQLMFPTDNVGGGPSTPTVPSPGGNPEPPVVVDTPPAVPSPPTPPSPPSPTPPSPPTPTVPSPPTVTSGFSVQLMSLSKTNPNFPEKINKLKGMVTRVYSKTDDKWKRYRVGTYTTKAEAEGVKAYVRALGFDGAFVVEEDGEGLIKDVNF